MYPTVFSPATTSEAVTCGIALKIETSFQRSVYFVVLHIDMQQ